MSDPRAQAQAAQAAETDPLVGTVLAERYRVLAPLGRGGMGAVYRVEHLALHKELACKVLHPELSRLDEVARRFELEAEAAARLDHPNIISVTDFGRTSDGLLFLVMELLDGPPLSQVIRPPGPDGEQGPGRPLPVERALHIQRQLLRGLAEAHAHGIVHRDLKPENVVLVERDGVADVVKIIDFGIAKMRPTGESPAGSGRQQPVTQAGVVFGTPEYLSPEQAMGEEADGRADLYAAGVILYEMLTGRRPFEASSRVEILSMHLVREPKPMREVVPEAAIPPRLEEVVRRAMAKRRDDRFADAAAFLGALESDASLPPPTREVVATAPTAARPVVAADEADAAAPAGPRESRLYDAYQLLVDRAREAGLPRPRLAVGLAAGVALVCLFLSGLLLVRALRPRHDDLKQLLARAEGLLARGEMEPARLALQQLLAAHPESARVHYLYGNLDYADGERERALGDYGRALRLDTGYAADPILRGNVRACLERRGEVAHQALGLLVDQVGEPALPDIVTCAKSCKDERTRRRAADAALKLGGPEALGPVAKPPEPRPKAVDKPPEPTAPDPHQAELDALVKGRTCKDRKKAALFLIETNDARYKDALATARGRRGGFLGLQGANRCMYKELDAALRRFDEK